MAMTIDEMVAVLQAYKDGKVIEYRTRVYDGSDWQETGRPCWDFGVNDYRVRPEPTRLEVANKFWKDTFGIDNAISDTCCPVPINEYCEGCKIFDICRYNPKNWWNAPYKEKEVSE